MADHKVQRVEDKIAGQFGSHTCKIMYVEIMRIIVALSEMRAKLIATTFERESSGSIPLCWVIIQSISLSCEWFVCWRCWTLAHSYFGS